MTESQATTNVVKELNKHGWFYKATDRFRAGIPDIVGVYDGQFYTIEMKIDYNKATPLQCYSLEKIRECGGEGFVVKYSNKNRRYETRCKTFKTTKELVAWILKLDHSSTKESALKKQKKGPSTVSY